MMFKLPKDGQGRSMPIRAYEAWDQFQEKLLTTYGLYTHDWDQPFVINQKVCSRKVLALKKTGEKDENLGSFQPTIQDKEHQQRDLQTKNLLLEQQLKLQEERIALLERLTQDLTKSKKDKNRLIIKQKAKIEALEQENKRLKKQSKVSQVY